MSTTQARLSTTVAASQNLLLLADDVGPGEVPALVRSYVHGAAWTVEPGASLPGVLDLLAGEPSWDGIPTSEQPSGAPTRPHATLIGPWRVDLVLRHELGLPSWATGAWVLDVLPQRSDPAPHLPGGYGPLLDAFGAEHPTGTERESLDLLLACARRLAGAVRTETGAIIEPDPASAVDLTLYSPTWLEPAALAHTLAAALPGIEVMPGVDAELAATLDGYGGVWRPAGALEHEDVVLVEVEAVEVMPAALAASDWTHAGIIAYRLRWTAPDAERSPQGEYGRRQRDDVRAAIEEAAVALHGVLGGEILDEDSFLVEPHQLGRA